MYGVTAKPILLGYKQWKNEKVPWGLEGQVIIQKSDYIWKMYNTICIWYEQADSRAYSKIFWLNKSVDTLNIKLNWANLIKQKVIMLSCHFMHTTNQDVSLFLILFIFIFFYLWVSCVWPETMVPPLLFIGLFSVWAAHHAKRCHQPNVCRALPQKPPTVRFLSPV